LPKRNHNRRTKLQQHLDPLLDDFVSTWLGRSWLTVGQTVEETEELVKESFDHDLASILSFLSDVTDGRVHKHSLVSLYDPPASLKSYWMVNDLRDDIPTLIQFPAAVGMEPDEARGWATFFAPRLLPNRDGRHSPNYSPRVSFVELRWLREAGVPLDYLRALDPGPDARYPAVTVRDLYQQGVTPEYAWALA
jgi:hypothetical protein